MGTSSAFSRNQSTSDSDTSNSRSIQQSSASNNQRNSSTKPVTKAHTTERKMASILAVLFAKAHRPPTESEGFFRSGLSIVLKIFILSKNAQRSNHLKCNISAFAPLNDFSFRVRCFLYVPSPCYCFRYDISELCYLPTNVMMGVLLWIEPNDFSWHPYNCNPISLLIPCFPKSIKSSKI